MLIFLQKCFWYGSAICLLGAVGWRPARATVAVALLLGVIEVVQTHLSGWVAELPYSLLALILAVTLGLLDQSKNPRNNSSSTSPIGVHG